MGKEKPDTKTNFIHVQEGVLNNLGKGLASAALQALLEARGIDAYEKKEEPTDLGRLLEVAAILDKERAIYQNSIFSSRARATLSEKDLEKIKELARVESDKFLKYKEKIAYSDDNLEEIICEYFSKISIPNNILGCSRDLVLSILASFIIGYIFYKMAAVKSEKDKQEILLAIKEKNKIDSNQPFNTDSLKLAG
jgi:hypothetical protein